MEHVRNALGREKVSERRACRVLGQPRSTQRRLRHVPDDEPRLVHDMVRLATQYGRYGYRRVTQLLCWEGGYTAICTGDSEYTTGPASIRHQYVANVAFVSVEDLAADTERPLHVLGHLIDHHLGCGGDFKGDWLSAGGGMSKRWRQAGQQLPELFALGHSVDPVAQSNVRDYFAQSLALFCRDRKRLNVADPLIYKWFRNTLWNRACWQADQDKGKGDQRTNG